MVADAPEPALHVASINMAAQADQFSTRSSRSAFRRTRSQVTRRVLVGRQRTTPQLALPKSNVRSASQLLLLGFYSTKPRYGQSGRALQHPAMASTPDSPTVLHSVLPPHVLHTKRTDPATTVVRSKDSRPQDIFDSEQNSTGMPPVRCALGEQPLFAPGSARHVLRIR